MNRPPKSTSSITACVSCLLLLAGACATHRDAPVTFDYQLDWGVDSLCVSLQYLPPRTGPDTLHYGNVEYGGQSDIFGCVKHLRVDGAKYLADSAQRLLILDAHAQQPISISYAVACRLPNDNLNCPMEMFRPNISPDFIYCHGINLFFRHLGPPSDAPSTSQELQRIRWGKRPDFPVFSLYHPEDAFATVTGPATDFHSTLIVGDRALCIDTLIVCGTINYMVTAPRKNAAYNRAEIARYFEHFYKGIAAFWEETTLPTYSLIVYPFEKIPFNVSGTGLQNGFCSRYSAYADTILTPERLTLFSHEIGHNWISADMENQWYGEGFNELQTIYMLVATGLQPAESFVEYLNNSLDKLHHSTIRNMPNDSISVNFWKLGDYSWIPYWRGLVYAFRLMGQIEHATGNPHAYKDLMMGLKDHSRNMTKDQFIPVAARYLDQKMLEESFERYIIQAETIPLDPAFMPSGCGLGHKPDGTPYIEITDPALFQAHFVL